MEAQKTDCPICTQCLESAIGAERAARDYYRRMAELFPGQESAVAVFDGLSRDEEGHARMLEEVRGKVHTPAIHSQASRFMTELKDLTVLLRKKTAAPPAHLEEACAFTEEVEQSEINSIYITLTTESLEPEHERDFILHLLDTHMKRIRAVYKAYDPQRRAGIKPNI